MKQPKIGQLDQYNENMIEMHNVNKWFGAFHVLRDINLSVAKGERIVICGPRDLENRR